MGERCNGHRRDGQSIGRGVLAGWLARIETGLAARKVLGNGLNEDDREILEALVEDEVLARFELALALVEERGVEVGENAQLFEELGIF